ncbi:MAG: M23 family metallopeptidase [Rhodospirillales bacterium]
MKRWRLFLVFNCLWVLAALPVQALELNGSLIQGGLVIGRVDPGTKVIFQDRLVRVSPDGLFAIGFGRNAAKEAVLKIKRPGGIVMREILDVKPRRYKISRIDGLPSRKVTPRPADIKRIRADSRLIKESRRRDTPKAYFRSRFMWPAIGRISGVFGSQRILNGKPRRPHVGVDIAAPKGTPVRAMADGIVTLVHQNMFFTGKTLMIDHGHGLQSVYAHLSEISVKEGTAVRKGDLIGRIGATGRATAPHLHWGVSWFATHLDPALVVGPMPRKKKSVKKK